jgi:hypothetical protein
MKAPRNAVALISVHGRGDGINQITFALQDGEKETVLEVAGKPTVLERLWVELDTTMDSLMNVASVPNAHEGQVQLLRTRARAQAETLAILMSPFFNNADEIAREAKKRYDARKSGNEGYVTPGIAGEEYVPPAVPSSPPRAAGGQTGQSGVSRTKSSSSSSRRTGKTLPPGAIPSIKEALEKKMFTVEQIARSYGLSVDEVKEQVGIA